MRFLFGKEGGEGFVGHIYINFGNDLIGCVHGEHRHTYINHIYIQIGNIHSHGAAAATGTGTNFPGLHISVRNAPGTKCPRCWMHSEQADPETGLCPRCAAVVAAQKAE